MIKENSLIAGTAPPRPNSENRGRVWKNILNWICLEPFRLVSMGMITRTSTDAWGSNVPCCYSSPRVLGPDFFYVACFFNKKHYNATPKIKNVHPSFVGLRGAWARRGKNSFAINQFFEWIFLKARASSNSSKTD